MTKGGNATGTLVLSGSSTYTGATTLNVGTLRANVTSIDDVSGAFGVHSAVTAAAATTLDINSNDTQIGSLAGAGSVTLGSAHLKLGSDNTSTSFSGVMSGTGPLTKQGTGTQTFTGVNTYSGATTISAGTLKLDTTGSIANSTIIVVADGATLDVSTKTGGFSLVGRDLTLDVGASGSKGFIDAGATAGALTYGGNLTLNVTTATPSSSYQLFNVNAATGSLSALTLAGSFTGSLTNNSGVWTATIGGQDWSFDQLTGYLSVVTVVPEPSTYAALLGLAALGFTAMRRRRNSTLIR